jgi:rhodanese-related sulfurtransferase
LGDREEMSIMLEGYDVTAEAVKKHIHHGDPLLLVELRHHHEHDWSLFKARGSLRLESDALEQHLAEIPHNRPIVVFSDCPGDQISTQAAHMLLKHGWNDVHKLVGGFDAYLEAGLPVEPVSSAVPATRIMLL